MTTFNYILIGIRSIFFLGSLSVQAQTFAETPKDVTESLRSNTTIQSYLASQNATATQGNTSAQNNVFIEQMGSSNESFVRVEANNATISLLQRGNSNSTLIDVVANELSQNIVQNGNQNRLFNLSNNPTLNQNMDIIQNGINQDITIYGSNLLSENIKIYMQGSDRSIIVRNFN